MINHLRLFTHAWNANLDELHQQESAEYRARIAQLDRLNRMTTSSILEARRELERAGYLLQ